MDLVCVPWAAAAFDGAAEIQAPLKYRSVIVLYTVRWAEDLMLVILASV